MATASVTVRVDEDTKRAAANIVEDFGFDLSSVTRAFYRQIVREQRIPLTLEYPTPNLESREAIRETKELIASGDPGYATVSEMFESGSMECHVANAGDWLLVWAQTDDQAYFQRTGGHDDLFSG